jgi:hypothetical protein
MAYQSKIPEAFFVLHHCDSPFLKSSPKLALGSLDESLHPASVHAVARQLHCSVINAARTVRRDLLTADGNDHGGKEHEQAPKSVENGGGAGLG